MQFGIITHTTDYKKLHEPLRLVQFVVFEKFTSAYLYSKLHKKIIWLLVNDIQVTISVSIMYGQMKRQIYFSFIGWKLNL